MSEWTHRAVIVAPVSSKALANAVARAFDPDVGGACSFDVIRCGATASHAVCDTPLIEATAQVFVALQTDAALLHQMCVADYADRWPALTPPTLAQCEQFLSMAVMRVEPAGRPLTSALNDLGFVLTPPSPTL